MSRRNRERLEDILAAVASIDAHLARGGPDDGLVFDAVRIRLVEIGEAVKSIDAELLADEPEIPWRDIAGMRDYLAHRYFDTAHSVVGPPSLATSRRLSRPCGDCLPARWSRTCRPR